MQAHPLERGLSVERLGLSDQSNALKDVGDVIQSADLGFQGLIVNLLIIRDLSGRLLKRNHAFPGDKKNDELLAEVP